MCVLMRMVGKEERDKEEEDEEEMGVLRYSAVGTIELFLGVSSFISNLAVFYQIFLQECSCKCMYPVRVFGHDKKNLCKIVLSPDGCVKYSGNKTCKHDEKLGT